MEKRLKLKLAVSVLRASLKKTYFRLEQLGVGRPRQAVGHEEVGEEEDGHARRAQSHGGPADQQERVGRHGAQSGH